MDTALIIALLSGCALLLGSLVIAFVGPIIYPWYSERMSRAQLRVQRRMQVRLMIENELTKGFLDLSSIGGYISLLGVQQVAASQDYFAKMIMENELKFGPWLAHTIQDVEVLQLCEDYRDTIRDIRVAVAKPPIADAEALLSKAKHDSNQKASEIVAKMDELGW